MLSVLTPLPGTPLLAEMHDRIVIRDLNDNTLTNAVLPTRLDERRFYEQDAALVKAGHTRARVSRARSPAPVLQLQGDPAGGGRQGHHGIREPRQQRLRP